MRIRPRASFALLSVGLALLSAGCPATYITVSSDAGAPADNGGAAVMPGQGGVGGGLAPEGYPVAPCNFGGSGGFGCEPALDRGCGVAGMTGAAGASVGIGGAGGDPCFHQFGNDPPSLCACYYGIDNSEYYGCLNRHDAQNGGVGGAPADLCEHLAPWSLEHERCVSYYQNGGGNGGCAGAPGDPAYDGCAGGMPVDAGSPD